MPRRLNEKEKINVLFRVLTRRGKNKRKMKGKMWGHYSTACGELPHLKI